MKWVYFITPYNSLNEEVMNLVGHHKLFYGIDYLPVTFLGAASPQLQSYSSGGNWQSCVLLVRPQDHSKPVIQPHRPARRADLWLYMWSKVGHSENILKLWCLQSFLSLLEMPSGYKSLWQVARTPSLRAESLKEKVFRLRPSEKREWKSEGVKQRTDNFSFLGSSHWDPWIFSESCVLDSQNHFRESPLSLKPVGGGLLSTVIQTLL